MNKRDVMVFVAGMVLTVLVFALTIYLRSGAF
jgi:hypothetical protein